MTVPPPRLALALAGGAARGLVHIGVLEVLEREQIRPSFIAGTSMGGLIGALVATGQSAAEIAHLARRFHFPRRFIPGGLLGWSQIFPSAVAPLRDRRFEDLTTELALTAADLEAGRQVIVREGPLLSAVRATCAVPGILPPERRDGRWLVDGGIVNLVPVDVAWAAGAGVVISVKPRAHQGHRMPYLESHAASLVSRVGRWLPNPATAKLSFEVLVRAAEIALETSVTLASSMSGPELLVEPDIDALGMRDFERANDAISAGRRAMDAALPALRALLAASHTGVAPAAVGEAAMQLDLVCGMAVGAHTPWTAEVRGMRYGFCSASCRERFQAAPDRYAVYGRTTAR